MSSSQVFPTLTGPINPESMAEVTAGIVSSEWYAPSSFSYNDPYATPYPTSTVESQPWTQYARSSVPDISMASYVMQQQHHHQQQQSLPPQFKDPTRPRSSPSTFGPSPENIAWATTSGLGIYSTGVTGQPTPVTSTFPPNVFQTYPTEEQYSTSSPPEIRQPQPRKPYTSIAPNPAGLAAAKRRRDEEEQQEASSVSGKRRKRTSSVASADLSEDDRFLVQLKEDESLPWKDIANRFQEVRGQTLQVAALQMRYKRLREKFRIWEDEDVNALKLAHEYWEKYKWEIISSRMLEYNVQERWPARHCARKWQELEVTATTLAATANMTPAFSRFSSPIEAPQQFAFMPLH